jgi:protein CpxP
VAAKITSHRADLRERLVHFLNPDQLTKWNAEVAKAKEFLGKNWQPSDVLPDRFVG